MNHSENYLFINVYCESGQYFVDVKTFIIITFFAYSEPSKLKLKVKLVDEKPHNCLSLNLENIHFGHVNSNIELTHLCRWPIILIDNYVISGLCSVARQMCRLSDSKNVQNLLGFREACLAACAENSIWTKFCEVDITETVCNILNNVFISNNCFVLPNDILRYEYHLSQPVKMYNIYKYARGNHNDSSLNSSTPQSSLKVPHDYAEGPYMTLADLILYPCFQIFFEYCQEYSFSIGSKIPLIETWFNRLAKSPMPNFNFNFHICKVLCDKKVIVPQIENVSLYKTDPTRSIAVKHTKQYKLDSAFSLLEKLKDDIQNDFLPFGFTKSFNWQVIPLAANPNGGALPAKRADRKREQLENLVKATLEVVGDEKYTIVDFCSGSGHLGIIVAFLLPNCKIILVENKERSLSRAKETILKLNLSNVTLVQSNLDYFVGSFDLGLALHACGVATDLVLQMCIRNKAHFIICPCCYGGIKDCHEIIYPRSDKFKTVFKNLEVQYFNLAHAADQTHEQENSKTKQGYFCMDIIDTDRRFYAESCGYNVHLGKLQPETCTYKNNLLVGMYVKNVFG